MNLLYIDGVDARVSVIQFLIPIGIGGGKQTRNGMKGRRVADESVVVKMDKTAELVRSEGADLFGFKGKST